MSIRFYSEAGARPSKEENLANLSTHCMIVPSKKGKQNRNQMFPRFTEHYYLRGIVPSSNGWFYAHTRSLSEVVHSTSVFRKIRVCIVWGHPPVWDKDHIYAHLQHTIAIPCSTHLEKKCSYPVYPFLAYKYKHQCYPHWFWRRQHNCYTHLIINIVYSVSCVLAIHVGAPGGSSHLASSSYFQKILGGMSWVHHGSSNYNWGCTIPGMNHGGVSQHGFLWKLIWE